MPTLKIDGQEITVEDGTRVIEAADSLGIPVPRFCYHPGLSVAANCRMCLVETNRSPKPVPACHDVCQDGMEVQTASDKVKDARRAVLEYTLLNHPVDCPICDQAGECDLQDLYFDHDSKASRHYFRKGHKPKTRAIGPNVVSDAERCINCTRCVRFCEEIAGVPQLQQVNRGGKTFIDVFPGAELDNPYSMCVADVCPVGAMTTRDFRFKCRTWFLSGIETVCAECSRGCSIRVDTYKGEIQRIVPRENPNVNRFWACDAGRLAYHAFDSGRLESPRVKGGDVGYAEAMAGLAGTIRETMAGEGKPAAVLSPFMTCEDAFAAISFLKGLAPTALFCIGGRDAGEGDDTLIREDKAPNRAGLELVLNGLGVEAINLDQLDEAAPSIVFSFGMEFEGQGHARMAVQNAKVSAVFSSLDRNGDADTIVFPTVTPYETDGTWVNEFGVLQRVRPAVEAPEDARQPWRVLADLAKRLDAPLPADDVPGLFACVADIAEGMKGLTLDDIGPFGVVLSERAQAQGDSAVVEDESGDGDGTGEADAPDQGSDAGSSDDESGSSEEA